MWKLDLNNVIQMLVDHELDRKSSTKFTEIKGETCYTRPAVYFLISLNADDYNLNRKRYSRLYMMFTGNTSVFYTPAYDSDGNFIHDISKIPPENWINSSNHDSCWRSDGFQFLTNYYFEMCKEVSPLKAPINVSTSADLGFISSYQVKHCNLTIKQSKDNDYKYDVVAIEKKK